MGQELANIIPKGLSRDRYLIGVIVKHGGLQLPKCGSSFTIKNEELEAVIYKINR